MAVPKSAFKPVARKCPVCDKKFENKATLVSHIDKVHSESIPPDWTAARYENYTRTGQDHGTCTECKKNTEWNESTWKYNRLCGSPKCREAVSKRANKNMIGKYGKVHLLDDPEMQRKMIYSKKTSGTYYWSTDNRKKQPFYYASKMELAFLEMLDVFLNMDPTDVLSPSPHNYTYKYEGKDHIYIPDVYISSLNLEVEIKEPKDNQNKHPKIQAVDKVKEQLKDDVMKTIKEVNYIKINGTDYSEFFTMLNRLKEQDIVIKQTPIISRVDESTTVDGDSLLEAAKGSMDTINSVSHMLLSLSSSIASIPDLHPDTMDCDAIVNNLKKMVDACDSIADCDRTEHYIKLVKDAFDKELNNREPKRARDNENEHDIKKALRIINEKIEPSLEKKRKEIIRHSYVTEGIDYENDCFVEEAMSVTAEKNRITYKPVFVFLSRNHSPLSKAIVAYTGQQFSHASISFNTKLADMYSFGPSQEPGPPKLGFVDNENILNYKKNPKGTYALYMYIAPEDQFEAMKKAIDEFKENKDKFHYSFKGLINIMMGRTSEYEDAYFCSEFVSAILAAGNPKMLKKHQSLYTPGDLAKTRKMIKVSAGKFTTYDENKIDRTVKKMLTERGFTNVNFKY